MPSDDKVREAAWALIDAAIDSDAAGPPTNWLYEKAIALREALNAADAQFAGPGMEPVAWMQEVPGYAAKLFLFAAYPDPRTQSWPEGVKITMLYPPTDKPTDKPTVEPAAGPWIALADEEPQECEEVLMLRRDGFAWVNTLYTSFYDKAHSTHFARLRRPSKETDHG